MKNNKLPLKERYNNFIQKHPKFWLTFIYCVLMFVLVIAMFIAVFSPPANETASADFRQSETCSAPPTTISENYVMLTSSGLWDKEELIHDYFYANVSMPAGYFTVSAVLYRDTISSSTSLYSYRYLNFYAFFDDNNLVYDIYLFYSNTPVFYNPNSPNIPADAMSIVPVSDTSKFPLYASDFSYHSLYTGYIRNGIDEFLVFKTCPVFSSGNCSPDDLKAEYDKGHSDGFASGKNEGLIEGEDIGYNKGFVAGQNSVDPFPNPVSYLIEPIISFLNIKFFDTLTLGGVLSVGIFVMVAVMFIKLFAGG